MESREDTAAPKALSPQEEMKRLEGIWAITSLSENEAHFTPGDAAKNFESIGRVVIQGDRMTIRTKVSNRKNSMTFRFWVDPARSPGTMALIPADEKVREDQDDLPIRLGIYELKGDTLRICIGVDRPDKYETSAGSGRAMMVLKWAFPVKAP